MHISAAVDHLAMSGFVLSVRKVIGRLLVRIVIELLLLMVTCHISIVACFFSKVSLRVVIIIVKPIVSIAVDSQRFKWQVVLCFIMRQVMIGVHVF